MSHRTTVITDIKFWSELRCYGLSHESTIGFVPTMGALHAGHISLLEGSVRENDISVLSIYVNPTQFNNPDDLAKYPITLAEDTRLAEAAGIDYILVPTYAQIYPDGYRYRVSESQLATQLCGAFRPGHFDGVLTVVMKLLNLVQPTRAYFGEKDYQQLELVRGMVETFFLNTEIVACPTVREPDGLAMSSRNVNLSPEARAIAPRFHAALEEAETPALAIESLTRDGFRVEYVEDIGARRYGAVHLGGVRLIDNVKR